MMIYPTAQAYNIAIMALDATALSPRFRGGRPTLVNNRPVVYAGGYSRVYKIALPAGAAALRCWIAEVADAKARYSAISSYLRRVNLPYFVGCEYLDPGLLVEDIAYPVLYMQWVEGETLGEFVAAYINDSHLMRLLADKFLTMVQTLHQHQIAHGDLQDQNMLVEGRPHDPLHPLALRLIDYDSLYVPALDGYRDTIAGIPNYQHPARNRQTSVSPDIDYFSELVIYLSLRAYAENPDLYAHDQDARLLFEADDFLDPDHANSFAQVAQLSSEVRYLGEKLAEFCRTPNLFDLQPLEQVLSEVKPRFAPSLLRSSLANQALKSPQPAPPASSAIPSGRNVAPRIPRRSLASSFRTSLRWIAILSLTVNALALGTFSGVIVSAVLKIDQTLPIALMMVAAALFLTIPTVGMVRGSNTGIQAIIIQGVGVLLQLGASLSFRVIGIFTPYVTNLLLAVFSNLGEAHTESMASVQAHLAAQTGATCLLLVLIAYMVLNIHALRIVVLGGIAVYLITSLLVIVLIKTTALSLNSAYLLSLPIYITIIGSLAVNVLSTTWRMSRNRSSIQNPLQFAYWHWLFIDEP